jgi:hypothetical protein
VSGSETLPMGDADLEKLNVEVGKFNLKRFIGSEGGMKKKAHLQWRIGSPEQIYRDMPSRLVVEPFECASDFRKIGFNSRVLILGPWKVIAKA